MVTGTSVPKGGKMLKKAGQDGFADPLVPV